MVVVWAREVCVGGWDREILFNGGRVSVLQDEKDLEMDGEDGDTMV